MCHHTSLTAYLLLALGAFLALGCSKRDAPEASDEKSTAASEPAVAAAMDSTLVGIYKIDRYQQSGTACDQLIDIDQAAGRLVLYTFQPNDGSGKARLGGAFCDELGACRAFAKRAPEPAIGYSFLGGDDTFGWKGWAVTGTAPVAEKCGASVQSHALTSPKTGGIHIETTTVDVVFEPVEEKDGVATCSNKHAIAVANTDLPCKSRLVLEATREADL